MSEPINEAVDQLLREAHILRMRKQFAEAETRCRQALEVAPDDVTALDMLAEFAYEKGDLAAARDLCQRILEIQPDRGVTETRLARITLDLAEQENDRLLAHTLLAGGGESSSARKRRVTIALMASLLFAGAGQLYNGEVVKGGILAVTYLVGIVFGGTELLRLMFNLAGVRAAPPEPWRVLLGFVGLVAWIYSVLDAPARAQKMERGADLWE